MKKIIDRFLRLDLRMQIPIALIVGTLVWMLSGALFSDKYTKNDHSIDAASNLDAIKKRCRLSIAREVDHQVRRNIDVFIKNKNGVTIRSEVKGVVYEIYTSSGSYLKKGDKILSILSPDIADKIKAARLAANLARKDYEVATALFDKKLTSQYEKRKAHGRMLAARADYKNMKLNSRRYVIFAPFDGYIDHIAIDKMEYIQDGSEIAKFASTDSMLAAAYVDSKIAGEVRGAIERSTLSGTEGSDGINDEVVNVGFAAKNGQNGAPIYLIQGEFNNSRLNLFAGNLAQLSLYLKSRKMIKIPKSSLYSSSDGSILVKVLDSDANNAKKNIANENDERNKAEGAKNSKDSKDNGASKTANRTRFVVKPQKIEILDEDSESFFITGIKDGSLMIVGGVPYAQEYSNIYLTKEEIKALQYK